jgi:hypothetical protein
MNKSQIEKTAKNLNFRFPVIGHYVRMNAVKKLAAAGTVEVIPQLIEALNCKDFKVQAFANQTLRNLKNPQAIDLLCKIWFQTREEKLDRIISEKKFIAQVPIELRVEKALKAGKIELCDKPEAINSILKKIYFDKDLTVKQNAKEALINLKNPEAIILRDKYLKQTREKKIEIAYQLQFQEQSSLEIRVATALKARKNELCDNPDSIDSIYKLLSDRDRTIKKNSEEVLRSLKNKDAIDALCEGIIKGTYEQTMNLAVESGYKPMFANRRCLFYLITGQIEQYLDLDFEFEHLRAEYMAAPAPLQERIRTVIQQSGDNRLMGIFGEVRRKFIAKDLTAYEAELMLDVYGRNRQWEEIFALLFFMPLSLVPQTIDKLLASGWEPTEEEQKSLLQDLKKERKAMGGNPKKPAESEVMLGPVFAKWIERGRNEFASKNEIELRLTLQKRDPPEAVAALAAMVSKNFISDADRKLLEKHPHWLVRMAYIALAPANPKIILTGHAVDTSGGGEYWLKYSPALLGHHFMQLQAANFNPELLHQLNTAVSKKEAKDSLLKNWAMLLSILAAYTLRNTIAIGAYEKRIEDTAISV